MQRLARVRIGRRSFLRLVVVSAALGCRTAESGSESETGSESDTGDEPEPSEAERLAVFAQGIASGDPTASSLILWTRVSPQPGAEQLPIDVDYEVALDEAMHELVASGTTTAQPEADHTLHLKLTELEPGRRYHYRFTAHGVRSWIGQTKTAPPADADVPVRFAVACCQDYVIRYYHAYRELSTREVDFVLHLGDYVYEYESGTDVEFMAGDAERSVVLPDGLEVKPGVRAAVSLADYRTLYRTYKSDPQLREAHRLAAFVAVWDDHEFANDCWQDHANDFDGLQGEEQSTVRREAATRAWFEYMPVDLEYVAAAGFPDDIRVYRSLRFGAHVELFLNDQRYYRDDHLIPEGPADPEVGKIIENSPLGSRVLAIKPVFDEREALVQPTMLGAEQRAWLIDGLTRSSASWKLWASPLMVAQLVLDLSDQATLPEAFRQPFYFKTDHWDGFRSERAQILAAIAGTPDVVVLSGDLHGFYAAHVHVDFDAPQIPIAVEFTASAISSASLQEQVEKIVASQPLLTPLFGDLVGMFDDTLRSSNAHFAHVDSAGLGIMIIEVGATQLSAEFVSVRDVFEAEPTDWSRRRFTVARGSSQIQV